MLSDICFGLFSNPNNVFKDLCKYCCLHNVILPSIEAFEEMIEIPCVFMVFYEYFFKSCVGDSEWKQSCIQTSDLSAPVFNYQTEAFALLVLRNNYFAWLLEVLKKARGVLVTDYDDEATLQNKNDVGNTIVKVEVNLAPPDCDNDDESEDESSEVGTPLLVNETHPAYTSLRVRTVSKFGETRVKARQNPRYKELLEALVEYDALVAEVEASPDKVVSPEEQRKKKRQVSRDLRVYTNGKDENSRFKGWSKKAKPALADLTIRCKESLQKPEKKRFLKAYRQTFLAKIQSAKKRKRPGDDAAPIDHNKTIWGFDSESEEDDQITMVEL